MSDLTVRVATELSEEQIETLVSNIVSRLEERLIPRQWKRPEDAASFLSVSADTLDRWALDGVIDVFRHGRIVLFDVNSLRQPAPAPLHGMPAADTDTRETSAA